MLLVGAYCLRMRFSYKLKTRTRRMMRVSKPTSKLPCTGLVIYGLVIFSHAQVRIVPKYAPT
jgi:hypothetical protein